MDPDDTQLSRLRAINFRLSNISSTRLPHHIPQICQLLTSSKNLFTISDGSTIKTSSEHTVLVHRFKTRLSSLLQDRSVEGRWAGIVLVKATIETGGWQMLRDCGAWVRALITILNKQDPPNSKKLCIIALTRVFILTKGFPTLMREVATPSLPPFITACLNHFQVKDTDRTGQRNATQRALLEPILESFTQLIPRHPTIFRPFALRLRTILLQLVCHNPYQESGFAMGYLYSASTSSKKLAQRAFVQLHSCAPKLDSAEEWDTSFKIVVATIHETADEVFRAVVESWQSSAGVKPPILSKGDISDEPSCTQPDSLGNPGWRGLSAGIEKMVQLLGLLCQYVATSTSVPVLLRTGLLADLLTRMFLVTVPRVEEISQWQAVELYNKQVSKQEREELFALLPRIHIATMEVLLRLVQRLSSASIPLCSQFLSQIVWVFEAEQDDLTLRASTYSCLIEILKIVGPSINISFNQLEDIIEHCSKDAILSDSIMMESEEQAMQDQKTNGRMKSINPDMVLDSTSIRTTASTTYNGLQDTARRLLSTILSKIPADQMSQIVREKLDRAAVYSANVNSMTASILNPPPLRSSLLPIMARLHPDANEVEAILRPRMPVMVAEFRDTYKMDGKDSIDFNSGEKGDMDDMEVVQTLVATRTGLEVDRSAFPSEMQIRTEITPPRVDESSIHPTTEFSADKELGGGDEMSALEAAIEAQSCLESIKRSPGVDEEDFSTLKRPRLEERDTVNIVTEEQAIDSTGIVVPSSALLSPIVGSATIPNPEMVMSSVEAGNENFPGDGSSDDTDGFEMPPLVFKSDDEEDEV